MTMDNSTRRMINSLAEDVLSAYNISVPIGNIDEIVEKLGGTIQKEAFFSDGAVEKEGNGFKIIVSPFQDEKRERFTIAHELGHLFLHMGYRTNNELWEKQENNIYHRIGNSEKEYQANEFAAAFLMPATEYLSVLNKVAEGNMVDTSKIAEYLSDFSVLSVFLSLPLFHSAVNLSMDRYPHNTDTASGLRSKSAGCGCSSYRTYRASH